MKSLSKRVDSLESRSLHSEVIPSVSDVLEDDALSVMADIRGLDSSPVCMPSAPPIEPKAPIDAIKASVKSEERSDKSKG